MLQNLSCESGGHTVFYCFCFSYNFTFVRIFSHGKKFCLQWRKGKKHEKLTIFLKVGKQK